MKRSRYATSVTHRGLAGRSVRRRRLFSLLAVSFALVLASATPALADLDGDLRVGQDGELNGSVDLIDGSDGDDGTAADATPVVGATGEWISYPVARRVGVDSDPNRGWCRGTRWELIADGEDVAARYQLRVDEYAELFAVGQSLFGVDPDVACPAAGGDVLDRAVAEDVVRRYVRSDRLPRPVLEVPPGRGLTGMPAYLVTGHSLVHELTPVSVDLGMTQVSLSWSASGRSEVDWGDGTVSIHEIGGQPWPDGEVVHTYIDRGTYRISVADTWTVSYRIAGLSGTVTETLAPVELPGFEVRERQSVRIANG